MLVEYETKNNMYINWGYYVVVHCNVLKYYNPTISAGTWRQNNVVSTSRRRYDVALTLIRRCFRIVCLFVLDLTVCWLNVRQKKNNMTIN